MIKIFCIDNNTITQSAIKEDVLRAVFLGVRTSNMAISSMDKNLLDSVHLVVESFLLRSCNILVTNVGKSGTLMPGGYIFWIFQEDA